MDIQILMKFMTMNKLAFGTIVLLNFPFSDGSNSKKRPALVIRHDIDNDIIVYRITSHIYETELDIFIENWEKSGLKLPSVIRIHKIATLELSLVERVMGTVDSKLLNKIQNKFSKIPLLK